MGKLKKIKNEGTDYLKDLSQKLLELMMISADVEVGEDKKNDSLTVKIDAKDEAGLVIGNRGMTLNSIQVILGMIYKRKTGEWQRIVVDVSNWREKEEERLISLATITAQRAKDTGEVQYLYNLTPAQRRVIHLTLSENPGVSTESQGEGKDRYLAITPKG